MLSISWGVFPKRCPLFNVHLIIRYDFCPEGIPEVFLFFQLILSYARPCGRCDVRRDFGRLLLSDHALLADSRMGEYILLTTQMDPTKNLLDSTDEENKRIYTLMAAVVYF